MSHDIFESERYRVERVLEILEHAVSRLGARTQVSVSLLKDAVAFLRGAEETAFEAAQEDDSEPTLSGCLEYYTAARRILAGMQETLQDLELGDASCRHAVRPVGARVHLPAARPSAPRRSTVCESASTRPRIGWIPRAGGVGRA